MQTTELGHSIEAKNSSSIVFSLEELSCLRYVSIKYSTRAVVNVSISKTLNGQWVSAARGAIITHSKLRRVQTGSLPCRFVKIDFIEGDVRLVQELNLFGCRASDLKSDLSVEDTELFLNHPYTFIYN